MLWTVLRKLSALERYTRIPFQVVMLAFLQQRTYLTFVWAAKQGYAG